MVVAEGADITVHQDDFFVGVVLAGPGLGALFGVWTEFIFRWNRTLMEDFFKEKRPAQPADRRSRSCD